MKPITLFDKSFLQSLSVDEAVLFDNFFMSIICPLFGFGAKFLRGQCDLGFPELSDQAASTAFQSSGIVAEWPPNVPVLN